jgi:hypothetical protein
MTAMPGRMKSSHAQAKAELIRLGLDYMDKDIEKGLSEIEQLPDGHRKRWILGVKKNLEDQEIVMRQLRRLYPGLKWPEQLPRLGIRYDDAIPILLHWLPKIPNSDIRASIAVALGQRWIGRVGVEAIADGIAATLRDFTPSGERDYNVQAMLNALVRAADATDLLRAAEVGFDPELPDREKGLLIFLLGKRRSTSGASALIALMKGSNEQHLVKITNELLKNRTETAKRAIGGLKEHPLATVRELALSGKFRKSG